MHTENGICDLQQLTNRWKILQCTLLVTAGSAGLDAGRCPEHTLLSSFHYSLRRVACICTTKERSEGHFPGCPFHLLTSSDEIEGKLNPIQIHISERKPRLLPYEQLSIQMSVFGDGIKFLPYIILAWKDVAERGVGQEKSTFSILRISHRDEEGHGLADFYRGDIDAYSQPLEKSCRMVELMRKDAYRDTEKVYEDVQICFLTPICLKPLISDASDLVHAFRTLIVRRWEQINNWNNLFINESSNRNMQQIILSSFESSLLRSSYIIPNKLVLVSATKGERTSRGRWRQDGWIGTLSFYNVSKDDMFILRALQWYSLGLYTHLGMGQFRIIK